MGVRFKAEAGVQWVQIYGTSAVTGGAACNFDIINGVAALATSRSLIRSLGDGWYECQMLFVAAATSAIAQIVVNAVGGAASARAATDGPTSGSFLVAHAQVNQRQNLAAYQSVA